MRKLTCKVYFNSIFHKLVSRNFKNIKQIEILKVLKENTTRRENIGIPKITLKKNQTIKELKFSKYFISKYFKY